MRDMGASVHRLCVCAPGPASGMCAPCVCACTSRGRRRVCWGHSPPLSNARRLPANVYVYFYAVLLHDTNIFVPLIKIPVLRIRVVICAALLVLPVPSLPPPPPPPPALLLCTRPVRARSYQCGIRHRWRVCRTNRAPGTERPKSHRAAAICAMRANQTATATHRYRCTEMQR